MDKITHGFRLGIDVGSTTVKLVILDTATNQVLFSLYQRHNAKLAAVPVAPAPLLMKLPHC